VLKVAAAPLAVDGRLPAYRGQGDDAEPEWRLDRATDVVGGDRAWARSGLPVHKPASRR
jgi:hypothetical protein